MALICLVGTSVPAANQCSENTGQNTELPKMLLSIMKSGQSLLKKLLFAFYFSYTVGCLVDETERVSMVIDTSRLGQLKSEP